MTWTTGKSVLLADGQEQTQVILTDANGSVLYEDHLSHPVGDVAALTARVRILDAKLMQKPQPSQMIATGTVLNVSPLAPPVPPSPPADAADRQAFNDAMLVDLRAVTLSKLSQKTQGMYRPEWAADVPVGF